MLLREPLKPTRPEVLHPIELPCMSVMVTWVLLNVARMLATPVTTFLAPLARMIFVALGSSPSSSAAEGAAADAHVSRDSRFAAAPNHLVAMGNPQLAYDQQRAFTLRMAIRL